MVQAAIAAAALAYQAISSEQQRGAAKRGRRDAQEAQRKAESAALGEARRAEEEENRAKQKGPDLNVLLGDQLPRPDRRSIDVDRLLLGRPGKLGLLG